MRRRLARVVVPVALAAACILAARVDRQWLSRRAGAVPAWPAAGAALGVAVVAGRRKGKRTGPQAAAALTESNERLRLALAAGKMGTWTRELEEEGRVLLSPELEAIIGLHPGEFPGTETALYELIHPEDRELVRQAFERAVQIQSDYEVEFRFLPRDRPPGWMLGQI